MNQSNSSFCILDRCLATLVAVFISVQLLTAADAPREKLLMDFSWKFHLGNEWGTGEQLINLDITNSASLADYQLWSPESPKLYTLVWGLASGVWGRRTKKGKATMECGGKRSATPLLGRSPARAEPRRSPQGGVDAPALPPHSKARDSAGMG